MSPTDGVRELAKKRVAYGGEEVGTAETLMLEQVLLGLPPKGVAGSPCAASLCMGHVREARLDADAQVLPHRRLSQDLGLQ